MKSSTGLSNLVGENEKELRDQSFRRLATILGLTGCFPFLAIGAAAFRVGRDSALHTTLIDLFFTWSIVVLAFLGGIRWGAAIMRDQASALNLWMSFAIPFLAWIFFLLPDNFMVLCLLVAYCGLGAWDSISANNGILPKWFGKTRIIMTLMVALAHVLVFISLF